MSDNKIKSFPVKPKLAAKAPLTVVPTRYDACRHNQVLVDEKLAEVECADCGAKLNPMWVLINLAHEDSLLRTNWAGMRAEIRLLGERTRTKCQHCGKMTRVSIHGSDQKLRELAQRIKAEESL